MTLQSRLEGKRFPTFRTGRGDFGSFFGLSLLTNWLVASQNPLPVDTFKSLAAVKTAPMVIHMLETMRMTLEQTRKPES